MFDQARTQGRPEMRHVAAEGAPDRRRRLVPPDLTYQSIGIHDLVHPKDQVGQDRTLLGTSQAPQPIPVGDLQRSQDPELHGRHRTPLLDRGTQPKCGIQCFSNGTAAGFQRRSLRISVMTKISVYRIGAVLALSAALAVTGALPAAARPHDGRNPNTPRVVAFKIDHDCPLRRIDRQLLRCDNWTGAGVPAPLFIPEL